MPHYKLLFKCVQQYLLFTSKAFIAGFVAFMAHIAVASTEHSADLFAKTDELGLEHNAHYYDLPSTQTNKILEDYKDRISNHFKIPKGLESLVQFWFRIYTQYSSHQVIFYDEADPKKIYYVQDDREDLKQGPSVLKLALASERKTKNIRSQLHAAFQALIVNPNHKFKSGSIGNNIIRAWGRRPKIPWKSLASRLRSQRGLRDFVLAGIQRAEPFSHSIDDIFVQHGIPKELAKVAFLESSFQIYAHSKANAVGVWQFLEPSAREYLIIDKNSGIDERLSPIKAAHAAAKMFKRNIRLLDDYALAVIAYNHGPKNLMRIKNRYGVHNIDSLLNPNNKESPLGYASRNYYAEFLAILHACQYAEELYGIKYSNYNYSTSIVTLKKDKSIYEISSEFNVSLHDLKIFNPDLFTLERPIPLGARIVIPYKKIWIASDEI